jgi:hypothetical protein
MRGRGGGNERRRSCPGGRPVGDLQKGGGEGEFGVGLVICHALFVRIEISLSRFREWLGS